MIESLFFAEEKKFVFLHKQYYLWVVELLKIDFTDCPGISY